jgi:GMP synthase (glutamine-hydrolysing)
MNNMVLVLDLGDGRGSSVARRVRSEQVYCEVLPISAPIEAVRAAQPMGILLAGAGAEGIPSLGQLIGLGVPILAMGSGARLLLGFIGGTATPTAFENRTAQVSFEPCALFEGLGESERFFERLDAFELPEDARAIATTEDGRIAAFCMDDRIFGMQFYTEQNDPDGFQILRNFVRGVCGCEPLWQFGRFLEEAIRDIREKAGESQVLLAVSGGTDSAVCAAMMHRALGDALTCIMVETGLMRKGELDATRRLMESLGIRLRVLDARQRFLTQLDGVSSSVQKTGIVDDEIMAMLEEEARGMGATSLGLGITYSDILMGVPETQKRLSPNSPFKVLIQPVRRLFKEEVRQVADELGLPAELAQRPSFPIAGLAVRMMGVVTLEKLTMLRESDAIFCDEIQKAGLDKRIRQYFAVLTEALTRSAEDRQPGYALALRAMNGPNAFRLPYDLLERVAERATSEVSGINRVVYDVTGHPPALVEWETD